MMINVGCGQHVAQQLLEEVGFFVSRARRANARDGLRAMHLLSIAQARGDLIIRLLPGGGYKLVALADHGCAQALRTVDKTKAPATAIAQPSIINLVVLPRTEAHDLVHAHIEARVTANATVRT